MEKNLLVSIILPVYNGELYLENSIVSCLNQTYNNIELIIVNDCSTDDSRKIVEDYQNTDTRIKIINNKTNKKLPASLNIGHQNAKGDLITWTSHDNNYRLNAIESLVNTITNTNSDLVYSNYSLINFRGEEQKEVKLSSIYNLPFGNQIGACFLYKKKVFKSNNGYNESLFLIEDYDFWLRSFFKFKFYHLKENLYNYRVHKSSLTNQISLNKDRNIEWEKNLRLMYFEIFNSKISNLLFKIHANKKIYKVDLISNKEIISVIKFLNKNKNFDDKKIFPKIFIRKIIILFFDTTKSRVERLSFFLMLLKKYRLQIDFSALKLFIKNIIFIK